MTGYKFKKQKTLVKDVDRQQLRSWGLLIERDGKDYPSNAFATLTGNDGFHAATQVYYAEEMGVSKRTVSRMFAFL